MICSWGELIAWIKIYQHIWLTYAKTNGGGHFFWFLVDVAVNNADKIYCQYHLILENIYWMSLAFAESLLMRTITSIEIVCHLQNYSQVVTAYITLQTNYSLTISIAGFLRAHSGSVIYEDVLEPGYIIANIGLHVGCF